MTHNLDAGEAYHLPSRGACPLGIVKIVGSSAPRFDEARKQRKHILSPAFRRQAFGRLKAGLKTILPRSFHQ
jgi:hypothetical protein